MRYLLAPIDSGRESIGSVTRSLSYRFSYHRYRSADDVEWKEVEKRESDEPDSSQHTSRQFYGVQSDDYDEPQREGLK